MAGRKIGMALALTCVGQLLPACTKGAPGSGTVPPGVVAGLKAIGASTGAVRPGAAPEVEEILVDHDVPLPPGQAGGGLKMLIRWPDAPVRRVQALPATTVGLKIRVSAPDLSPAIATVIQRSGDEATASVRLEVPAGKDRTLTIEGLNAAGKVVTAYEGRALTVETGRYTPVTATMVPRVGTVEGTILDDETGLPEPYVTVEVGSASVMTDASGSFSVPDADVGMQTLKLSKVRFSDATFSVVVGAREAARLGTVRLQPYHWVAQQSGVTADLFTVLPLTRDEVWVGGQGGTLLRTRDGGKTWANVGATLEYYSLREEKGYWYIDDQSRYYRYYGDKLTRTIKSDILDFKVVKTSEDVRSLYICTTEGAYQFEIGRTGEASNWRMIDNPVSPGYFYYPQRMRSLTDGVRTTAVALVNEYCFISAGVSVLATTDRFSNVYKYSNPADSIVSLAAYENTSRVYAAGVHASRLYVSTNFGQSFYQVSTAGARTDFRGLRSLLGLNANDVLHAGYTEVGGLYRPVVMRTTDGGSSWNSLYQAEIRPSDQSFRAIAPVETGYCAVGTGGEVALNRPGTTTWCKSRIAAPGAESINLTDVAFLDKRTGWAVGDGGVILKY